MPAKADSHPQNADRIHDSAFREAEGIVLEFERLGQTSAAWSLMLGRIKAIAEERDRAHLLISDMRQAARRSATAVSRLASELDGMLAVNRPGDTFEPLGAAANRVVGDLPVDRALADVARRRWLAADGEVDADGRPVPLAAGEDEVCIGRHRRIFPDDADLVRAGLVETVRDGVAELPGYSGYKAGFIIHDEIEAVEAARSAAASKSRERGHSSIRAAADIVINEHGKITKAPFDSVLWLAAENCEHMFDGWFVIDLRKLPADLKINDVRAVSQWLADEHRRQFGYVPAFPSSDQIIPETFDDGSAADPTNDIDETAILADRVAALGDRHAGPLSGTAAVAESIRSWTSRRLPIATPSDRRVPRTAAE